MIEVESKSYQFLEGGGEMGALTRNFDWASTPVGPVDEWPQSLRTMVDVILHSEVPMLLFWGEQMIQIYNDAYRPSLGNNGKHPTALGQRGEECWPEIWPIIKPLIDRVNGGGATWSQNQLIPIFRNGRIEDVYWTFGYSPVRDESGKIKGVLVVCNETTEQVKAIKQIETSEGTLRSIILHAPVGICIVAGDDSVVEVVNDIFLNMVGRTREEIQGKSLWASLPEAKERYASILHEVGRSGQAFHGTEHEVTIFRHGAKETLFVDFIYEPLREQDNQRVMILAIDVTEKVLARKKIEESEQRYKTLISESTVAVALYTGPDLVIQYVNPIMTGYWGRDLSVVGKPLAEAVPELKDQSFIDKLQRVYLKGETYVGTEEEAHLLTDGKLKTSYFNFVYKPIRNADGEIYAIHHMAMDVTAQVLGRKSVEQSEANLRNIILKAPVAMCILRGPDLIIDIANDLMFQIWGKNREELMNKPIFEGLPEVRDQGFEELLSRVYKTGETFTAYSNPLRVPRDGRMETIYINFVYEPYRDPDGVIAGIMAVATDVTVQVKAHRKVEELVQERTKELAESNKNLQRSNSELAQFAYIASHDLQEPARKISTFTEMLKKHLGSTDDRAMTYLTKIEQSSVRMLTLIRDILSYSQLANEKQLVRRIDLNEVLKSVMSDFELSIEEKRAIITSDPLPLIEGIPVQIQQLFANLISNALKFTHTDRRPEIVIKCTMLDSEQARNYTDLRHDSPHFRISFIDNGIGFNQANAHQIFDIFQRLHGKSDYAGTGIGLAMCKKIAQNHHGDIYAESAPGKGSAFHLILPASLAA